MMPASKHGDPQLGIDIHFCIVPPSPAPVPLPTPHISIVFDPFDYVPFIGATVTVCGMKRASAGTNGIVIHIPPGFPFAPKWPDWTDELFMGSATVVADGDPFSYLALPVLGCQIVGIPSIPRLKKKPLKIMLLPTTFNLAIPTSVVVGGPPTISMLGLAFKGAFAALGRFAKSGLFRRLRQKLFGGLNPGFVKCAILRAEPVNILTGEVSVQQEDFTLPGRIPIEWCRAYASGSDHQGLCGHGWETPADTRLEVDALDGLVSMRHPTAGPLFFSRLPLDEGDEAGELEMVDGARLTDYGHEYRVRTKDDRLYSFPKALARINQRGGLEYPVGRIADLCGNWLDFDWRGHTLSGISESAGRRINFTIENGRITEVTLRVPGANVDHTFVGYEYDQAGDLVAVIDALGHPYRFEYDDHHLVRHTDRNGLSFYYEYDKSGEDWRVTHTWGDEGLYDYQFEYIDVLKERRITDSLGHVSVVALDDRGLPISEIDPLGGRTTYEYDDVGRTTAFVDPAGRRTEYAYDEAGNLLKSIQPNGSTIVREYQDGKVTAIVDPNGGTWQQQWDSRGLLVAQISPLGHTSRCDYDALGQLTAFANARGATTTLRFDGYGNIIDIVDPVGHRMQFAYDWLGNVVTRRDAHGRLSLFTYDAKSRLIGVQQPNGARMHHTYDAQDNLAQSTDEHGATTRFERVGLGEIARRIQPDGHVVEYLYDTEERLIGVQNQRGELFELRRDALGRVVEEVDYWGQSRRFVYNAGGSLLATFDGLNRRIEYQCDPLGRIVEKVAADGAAASQPFVETFVYDKGGQVIEARNPHVTIRRVFDGQGRLINEEQRHAAGGTFAVENSYDECGNRVRRVTSLGNTIEYQYDLLGTMVAARINGAEAMRVEHDELGHVTTEQLGADLRREYRYDAAGRLAEQTVNRNGSPQFSTRYEYGRSGYVEKRSDSRDGSERFAYDPLGRVLEHIDPLGRVTRYHHDPAGDRLVTHSFEPERPTDLADRRPARGQEDRAWRRDGAYAGSRYRFDRAGDLVLKVDADATLELEWDGDRHLMATRHNGLLTQYAYDPFGRRVFKENGGLRTRFFWDGDLLAAEEAASPAVSSREYAYRAASGIPWACIVSESSEQRLYYFDHDPNGAPVRALDEQGRIVWAVRYTAWGGIAAVLANDVDFRLRLQGQYEDPETGLSYNRYRYFEPQIGQFISQDLLGTAAGEGIYAFAVNTVGWADPLGLACQRATGHHLVDRIAGEIDAAAAHAARMLDRGLTAGTPWGEIYKNLLQHNPNHWMIPLARGNAIQQIADTRLMNNRYLRDAGVVFNQGHLNDVRNAQKNLLRPDYQVPLEGGRLGIIDVTTSGQGPKVNQYLDSANPSHTPSTNVFY